MDFLPLWLRMAFYFCRNKSNKSAFFFLGFFAAQGLYPCKSGRTTGCKQLPHCVRALANASANIYYAPAAAQATIFCQISPEASCKKDKGLWEQRIKTELKINCKSKSG
jgi:hypothetical protein